MIPNYFFLYEDFIEVPPLDAQWFAFENRIFSLRKRNFFRPIEFFCHQQKNIVNSRITVNQNILLFFFFFFKEEKKI
jgi:hypothetical protein